MRGERGAALVLAVMALTVIGALVAAAFFAGLQEQRMAEGTRLWQRAQGAVDAGLVDLLRQWPLSVSQASLRAGDSLRLPAVASPAGLGRSEATIYRLGPDLFVLVVEGWDRDRRARAAQGLLVRALPPCDSLLVVGLEMSHPKCQINNGFQSEARLMPLRSRSWTQAFKGT